MTAAAVEPTCEARHIHAVDANTRKGIYELVDEAIREARSHSVSVIGDEKYTPIVGYGGGDTSPLNPGDDKCVIFMTKSSPHTDGRSESALSAEYQRAIAVELALDWAKHRYGSTASEWTSDPDYTGMRWSAVRASLVDEIASRLPA